MLEDTVTLGGVVTLRNAVTMENTHLGDMVMLGRHNDSPCSSQSLCKGQEGCALSQVKMETKWEEKLVLQEETPG